MSLTINAFAGLARAGLRIVIQQSEPVVCCDTRMDFEAGGPMGAPFFTAYCATCFTLFVHTDGRGRLEKYLRDVGRLEVALGRRRKARRL